MIRENIPHTQERDRERQRETERDRERDRERQRETERDRERQRETERDRERQSAMRMLNPIRTPEICSSLLCMLAALLAHTSQLKWRLLLQVQVRGVLNRIERVKTSTTKSIWSNTKDPFGRATLTTTLKKVEL